jgi:DNA-binding NarL/FixJ family response regulator
MSPVGSEGAPVDGRMKTKSFLTEALQSLSAQAMKLQRNSPQKMIKKVRTALIDVAVIDDDTDLLQLIGDRLASAKGFATPLLFSDSKRALKKLHVRPVDVALVDLMLPGDSGVRVIRRLVESQSAKTVVAYSASTEPSMMLEAIRAGAVGYWVKSGDFGALEAALNRAVHGEPIISPAAYQTILAQIQSPPHPLRFDSLSRSETNVLALAAEGLACREIAARLQVSIHTVYVHNKRILKKLGVPDRLAAIARFRVHPVLKDPAMSADTSEGAKGVAV